MIVFVPALNGKMVQHDAVAIPVFEEMKRRGIKAKWGKFSDDADWYICTSPIKFREQRNKTIYLPHGIGLQEEFQCIFPVILFPGQYYKDVFNIQFFDYEPPSGWDEVQYPLIGWPKSDIWFNLKKRERKIKIIEKELQLPYDKTVFIAGAYAGGKDVVNRHLVNGIKYLINGWNKKFPTNIIFKGHSVSTVFLKPKTRRQRERRYVPEFFPIKKLMDSIEHCRFIDPFLSADIYDLIMVSDVVVSTQSGSVYTETLITGKPIIQLGMRWYTGLRSRKGEAVIRNRNSWKYTYTTKRFNSYPQIFLPGLVCKPKDIWKNVHRAFNKPDEFRKDSDLFVEKMVHKPDGHASERAVNAVERIMKQ